MIYKVCSQKELKKLHKKVKKLEKQLAKNKKVRFITFLDNIILNGTLLLV